MGANQESLIRNEDLLPIGSYRTDFELDLSRKLDAVLESMSWLDFDLAPSAIVELQWALSDVAKGRSEIESVMKQSVQHQDVERNTPMINVPCETELLEEVDQWLSSHCQGVRLNGDSIELVANTASSELELVLESQLHIPAATSGAQHDAKESQELQGLWLNKVKDRIQAEASLCREFSAKMLSENAKRVYAARAAALEFAFKLLTETSNPMGYLNNPVPDHYVHPTERGIRSRRIETQHFTELSDDTHGCSTE